MIYDIFLLFEKYDFNIHDLIKILTSNYELKVWPNQIEASTYDDYKRSIKIFDKTYFDEAKERVEESKIIFYLINDDYDKLVRVNELVKHCDSLKKYVIPLVFTNSKSYVKNIDSMNAKYDFICQLHENRIYNYGYDPYVFLGDPFSDVLKKVEEYLKKPLMVKCIFLKIQKKSLSFIIKFNILE